MSDTMRLTLELKGETLAVVLPLSDDDDVGVKLHSLCMALQQWVDDRTDGVTRLAAAEAELAALSHREKPWLQS